MSKPLAANRLLLGVDTWAQQTTAASGNFPAGSFWMRNGNYPTVPTELYLNTSGGANGWIKENLINLGVYNVKNFGAKGDGATDDTAAINAAVAAAEAAGGGVVYFPATANSYRITKPGSGLGSIVFDNNHDIALLGDGPASKIAMIGSAGAGDWYAVRARDGSTRLGFYNLGWDGTGITNPDPARQNHFLNLSGVAGDAHGGPTNIDVVGNWFGQIVGACVRNLGESTEIVSNVRVMYNAADLSNVNRSFVETQRWSQKIQVHWNWAIDTGAINVIDFEPTGGDASGNAGPTDWSIIGNQIDHGSAATSAITLSGITDVSDDTKRPVLAFNTITNGGDVQGLDINGLLAVGNIITVNSTTVNSVMGFLSRFFNATILGNVCISQNSTNGRQAIRIAPDVNGSAQQCVVAENICVALTVAAGGTSAIDLEGVQMVANGNYCTIDSTTVNVSVGVSFRATTITPDHNEAIGNFFIGTTQNLLTGVQTGAVTGGNFHNLNISFNFVHNSFSIVRFNASGSGAYLDWRACNDNNGVNATNAAIEVPNSNVGASIEGTAGPGPQFVQTGTTPGGNVAAPVGGVDLNTTGAAATILWIKETGAGVSGGTAGWVQDGGSDFTFGTQDTTNATAARFLAPGMAQATANTIEIKIALPRAGTIRNGRLTATAGVGGGNNTYTLRRNGSNTSVAVTVANTATTGTFSGSAVCSAADLLSVQVTKSLAPGTDQANVNCTFELTG